MGAGAKSYLSPFFKVQPAQPTFAGTLLMFRMAVLDLSCSVFYFCWEQPVSRHLEIIYNRYALSFECRGTSHNPVFQKPHTCHVIDSREYKLSLLGTVGIPIWAWSLHVASLVSTYKGCKPPPVPTPAAGGGGVLIRGLGCLPVGGPRFQAGNSCL